MGTIAATLATRRQLRRLAERRTGFEPVGPLARILERAARAGDERIYLVGERPGGTTANGLRRWAEQAPGPWVESPRGHYLEGEHPVLRFSNPQGGGELEVLRAAAYFGEGNYTPNTAAAAWEIVRAELARDFPGAVMLSSPAATGRDLLLRAIPRETWWPVIDGDTQGLIRSTSTQGRIEIDGAGARVAGDTIPELVVYDGRFMYAALCWGLPGAGRLEKTSEFLGQRRARYYGVARVPRDWDSRCECGAPGHRGLGVLGFAPERATGWEWPAEPGRQFVGWWDGAEILVALRHGWRLELEAAVVFDDYDGAGPLDGWARRLVAVRDRIRLRHGPAPDRIRVRLAPGPGDLAEHAVRSIVLHAIGAFHGARHPVTRSVPLEAADSITLLDKANVRVEGDRLVWSEDQGPGWPELSHPEWSAAIWARARARLLDGPGPRPVRGVLEPPVGLRTGALHVPSSSVLGFRTDAIYLTADPGWPDDGKPGRFRRKGRIPGPLPTPRTHAELLAVAR